MVFFVCLFVLMRPRSIGRYPAHELAAATDNFDRVIGRGGSGTVFVGMLHDLREVAIKRTSDSREEEFRAEITILSQVRHKHIVGLLGWCVEDEEKGLPLVRKEKERLLVLECGNVLAETDALTLCSVFMLIEMGIAPIVALHITQPRNRTFLNSRKQPACNNNQNRFYLL